MGASHLRAVSDNSRFRQAAVTSTQPCLAQPDETVRQAQERATRIAPGGIGWLADERKAGMRRAAERGDGWAVARACTHATLFCWLVRAMLHQLVEHSLPLAPARAVECCVLSRRIEQGGCGCVGTQRAVPGLSSLRSDPSPRLLAATPLHRNGQRSEAGPGGLRRREMAAVSLGCVDSAELGGFIRSSPGLARW